jgi:hypothetical protein
MVLVGPYATNPGVVTGKHAVVVESVNNFSATNLRISQFGDENILVGPASLCDDPAILFCRIKQGGDGICCTKCRKARVIGNRVKDTYRQNGIGVHGGIVAHNVVENAWANGIMVAAWSNDGFVAGASIVHANKVLRSGVGDASGVGISIIEDDPTYPRLNHILVADNEIYQTRTEYGIFALLNNALTTCEIKNNVVHETGIDQASSVSAKAIQVDGAATFLIHDNTCLPGTPQTGTGVTFTKVGSVVTLTDADMNAQSSDVGRKVTVSSSSSAGNDGERTITAQGGTSISYTNAGGVAEVDGSAAWSIARGQQKIGIRVASNAPTARVWNNVSHGHVVSGVKKDILIDSPTEAIQVGPNDVDGIMAYTIAAGCRVLFAWDKPSSATAWYGVGDLIINLDETEAGHLPPVQVGSPGVVGWKCTASGTGATGTFAEIYSIQGTPTDGDVATWQTSSLTARWRPVPTTNLLGASATDLSGWTADGATTGTLTTTEDDSTGYHSIRKDVDVTDGLLYEFSATLKAENRTWLRLVANTLAAGFSGFAYFNLDTLAWGSDTGNIASKGYEDVGNDYYRVWIRYRATDTETLAHMVFGATADLTDSYEGNELLQFTFKRLRVNTVITNDD